jgi:tetratricopeptide (TPR) repeat protein
MGERAKAEEILQRVKDAPIKDAVPNLAILYEQHLARLYDALGRRDEAFAILEKAFATRNSQLPQIAVDPAFDSMRSDPRFQDLVRRMGLPQ